MDSPAAYYVTPVGWHLLAYDAEEPCDWVDHSRTPEPIDRVRDIRPVLLLPFRVSPVSIVSAGPSRGLGSLRRA